MLHTEKELNQKDMTAELLKHLEKSGIEDNPGLEDISSINLLNNKFRKSRYT